MKLYTTMLNVIYSQLSAQHYTRTLGCLGFYNNNNNQQQKELSSTWDTVKELWLYIEYERYNITKSLEIVLNETFKPKPPLSKTEKLDIVPEESLEYMITFQQTYNSVKELCRIQHEQRKQHLLQDQRQ